MITHHLRRTIRKHPALRALLQRLYRGGQYASARLLSKLRRDDLFLIDVDPARIRLTVNQEDPTLAGSAVWHVGTVASGDWDLGGVPVARHGHVATLLQEHVIAKRPLHSLPAFQSDLERLERGEVVDSCTTPEEYRARWRAIGALFDSIASAGYRTQEELGTANPLDEIRVQIGRRGEFLFEEGIHRLAIAQALELPAVPVLVTRRHTQWAELRDAVLRIVLQRGFIHQPFDHPDLDSLPLHYGRELASRASYGHERWDYIRSSLPVKSGTVLDIGAYFGYFDHRLEQLGFQCFAVEPDRENLAVLNLYRSMRGARFVVWPQSIFEIERRDFDVVLALNIFHHFVRSADEYRRLVQFLQNLRCRALYLEPDANAGLESYRHFDEQEFVHFVQEHTGLARSRYLGQSKEGRGVYLLLNEEAA